MQQSLAQALQSPMDALGDLHNALDMEIHAGTNETAEKDKENSKETSKVGNTFLQWAWSQPRLLMDVQSTGAPSAHCPGGLPTQQ